MNSVMFVAFFACLAVANAGVAIAPVSAKIIQGPSTRTTVVGPDGSSISSVSPGGAIVQEDSHAAAIAYSAPLAYSAHAAPIVAAYSAYQPLAYSAPLAYSSGVVAEKQLDTLVAGPSGTIATSKTVHHPTLVAAPQVYAAGLHAYYI